MNEVPNSRFKFFPQLNDVEDPSWLKSPSTFSTSITDRFFQSDTLQDKFLRAIAIDRILPIKEVLESFEFFARVRKATRANAVADFCCGHGLLGILFATFDRHVNRVILVDKVEPESRAKLLESIAEVAPWAANKIENQNCKINSNDLSLPQGVSVVSAHACGVLTDACIESAIKHEGAIAVLPCCYPKSACQAPLSLQTALGLTTAFDIDRTYRLERAGYQVRWGEIPAEITPMNRLIYASAKRRETK